MQKFRPQVSHRQLLPVVDPKTGTSTLIVVEVPEELAQLLFAATLVDIVGKVLVLTTLLRKRAKTKLSKINI
jgi:hypothetical protein